MTEVKQFVELGRAIGGSSRPLELVFHAEKSPSVMGDRLWAIAEAIGKGAAGGLSVKRDDESTVLASPALTLVHHGVANLHYAALPEGPESKPFEHFLRRAAEKDVGTSETAAGQPAELLVLIAASCPNCPKTVRAAGLLALSRPELDVWVIDIQRFADFETQYSVKSVPFCVLDRELTLIGGLDESQLAEILGERGTDAYRLRVLRAQVEQGRFTAAAADLGRHEGQSQFVDLWRQSDTSLRMGLMLTAEEALSLIPEVFVEVVPALIGVLDVEDATLRGDTADLLGRIGDDRALAKLRRLTADGNPDVAEIAGDAIEEIEERGPSGTPS